MCPRCLLLVLLLLATGCNLFASFTHDAGDACHPDGDLDASPDSDFEAAPDSEIGDSDVDDADIHEEPDADSECVDSMLIFYAEDGTTNTITVPKGVSTMEVKAWGAGGNHEADNPSYPTWQCFGGVGGYTSATFEVEPDEAFTVITGAQGGAGLFCPGETDRAGFCGPGGGGLSGVFRGHETVESRDQSRVLIIAGGGGGAIEDQCVIGAGHGNNPSAMLESMQGGTPSDGSRPGGGGGYSGGFAGSYVSPGFGGTGRVSPGATRSTLLTAELGEVEPPHAAEANSYFSDAGTQESPGLVVIHFPCDVDQ